MKKMSYDLKSLYVSYFDEYYINKYVFFSQVLKMLLQFYTMSQSKTFSRLRSFTQIIFFHQLINQFIHELLQLIVGKVNIYQVWCGLNTYPLNSERSGENCTWKMKASSSLHECVSSRFPQFSPERRIVELDPQQVLHADLCWIVNDELVVEEGITAGVTNSCFHHGPHWHCHTIQHD